MTKREKIILFLAGISLLYGLYSFVLSPKNDKNTNKSQKVDFSILKKELLSSLNKQNLSPKEIRIYQLLNSDNFSDPFIYTTVSKSNRPLPENKQNLAIEFKYTGYVFLNQTRFAVINGKEYKEGEPLDISGFSLLQVNENYILIKGPGKDNLIKVPFLDTLEVEGKEKP